MTSVLAQGDDLTFTVRKKKEAPITTSWLSFDTLRAGKVYQIIIDNQGVILTQDSILCLNMDCRRLRDADNVEYLMFGRDKPGKAYIALYSYQTKQKKWRQTSMRPVVFSDRPRRLYARAQ